VSGRFSPLHSRSATSRFMLHSHSIVFCHARSTPPDFRPSLLSFPLRSHALYRMAITWTWIFKINSVKQQQHFEHTVAETLNNTEHKVTIWPIWTYQFYNTLASDRHDLTLSIIDLLTLWSPISHEIIIDYMYSS